MECCKEEGQLAEASKVGLGSKRAVVPMMIMMMMVLGTTETNDNLKKQSAVSRRDHVSL